MGVESMSDGGPPDWISSVNTVSPFCRLHDARPAHALTGHRGGGDIMMARHQDHNKWARCDGLQGPPDVFNLEDISPRDTAHLITPRTQAQGWAERKTQREPIHSTF